MCTMIFSEDFFENYWFSMPRSNRDDMKPRDENKLRKKDEKIECESFDFMFDTFELQLFWHFFTTLPLWYVTNWIFKNSESHLM